MTETSQKNAEKVLSKLMHPEINYSLVDLEMIKDIQFQDNKVTLTLRLPFLDVPIKEHLIQMIKGALTDLNDAIETQINLRQMSQQERDEFMKQAKKGWKL